MDSNIGNASDAREILEWVRGSPERYSVPRCVAEKSAPEGWEYVGHGSFRSVWRSPEGVAYKVEHFGDYDSQNGDEVMNLASAWESGTPEGCRLPKFAEFRVSGEIVVAIELIIGETLSNYCYTSGRRNDDLYERLHLCESRYGLGDLHDENVIVEADTGILVPVDFGG